MTGPAAAHVSVASSAIDSYRVFDYPSGFASHSAAARERIAALYGPFATADDTPSAAVFRLATRGTGTRRVWRILLADDLVAERPSFGAALRQLEYEIGSRVVAHRGDWLALHGATVFAASGAALLAGASGVGKSTLAVALAGRGYRVGGDDVAFLEPSTGLVRPLPRCFHLDARSRRLLRQLGLRLPTAASRYGFVTPADLGDLPPGTAPLRHLFLVERRPEERPRIASLAQAEMAVRLLPEVRWAQQETSEGLSTLRRLVAGADCYRLTTGRLLASVDAVASLLGPP